MPISPLLLLAACTPSLAPLYTDKDLVFDETLVGVWRDVKESKNYLVVTRSEDGKCYSVLQHEGSGTAPFTVCLLRLGDARSVDLYPDELPSPTGFYGGHLLQTHTFGWIDLDSGRLKINLLDPDWFKTDDARDSPVKPVFTGPDHDPLLMQTTGQLQAFALKYRRTKAFGGDSEWKREAVPPR